MFARTDRLLLRPGFCEDAAALAAAIGDEAIARNLTRLPWPYGPHDAAAWLARPADPARPSFLITQRTLGHPRIVGGIGIHDADDGGGAPELGYWIARPYWGLGFASEAGRAVMALARALKLPRLVSGHFADNPASGAVLRKLGFASNGRTIPRHSPARGEAAPCLLFEETDAAPQDAKPPRSTPVTMRQAMTTRIAA